MERKYAHNPFKNVRYGEPIDDWFMPSDLHEQWMKRDKKKIRIAPDQPINTSVFEEAIMLEYNGALTPEGLKEYEAPFIKEGDTKPIISFTTRLW